MLLASCGSEIKFHKWPSGDYHGAFQIPEAGFYIPSLSWCNEGELLATTVPSMGAPIVISVGQSIKTHQVIDLLQVQSLTFSKIAQKNLMLGTEDGHVVLYDINKKEIIQQLPSLPSGIKYLQYGALDTSLAAGCKNGQICLYNSRNNVCATFCVPNSNSLTAMTYHHKQPHVLAAASGDGIVVVWDSSTGHTKIVEKGHSNTVTDVAFSLGDDMVTVGLDQKFNGYDLRTKECVFSCMADAQLSAVGIMPTGDKIAVASLDGKLYCYDRRRIAYPVHTIIAHHPKTIGRIAFQNLPFFEEPSLRNGSLVETQHNSLSNGGTVVFNPHNRAHSTILESTDSACHIRSTIPTITADTGSETQTTASGDGASFGENLQLNPLVSGKNSINPMPMGLDYFNKVNDETKTYTNTASHSDMSTTGGHLSINRQAGVTNILNKRAENPNAELPNRIPAGLDAGNSFEPTKNDAITSWIKKLPGSPSQDHLTPFGDSEGDIGQVGRELVDVTKEMVDRLTDVINKEFMRIRMALSRGFIHMEYKMNARWQEFNSALVQLAGYELQGRNELLHDEFLPERHEGEGDCDDDQQQLPSRIPKLNFNSP